MMIFVANLLFFTRKMNIVSTLRALTLDFASLWQAPPPFYCCCLASLALGLVSILSSDLVASQLGSDVVAPALHVLVSHHFLADLNSC